MERRNVEEKWINHYSSKHEILLVGEGDFSFAACLAEAFGDASNITATSLDSELVLLMKHPSAEARLELLKEKGATVIHDVDASTMRNHRILSRTKFDRIVYNFPHEGFSFMFREHDSYRISLHQGVVRGFLQNAYEMVAEEGEVHITHKTAYPFSKWEIEKLGQEAGFVLKDNPFFYLWEYPGYTNKKGSGLYCDQSFPVGDCRTYKFAKP